MQMTFIKKGLNLLKPLLVAGDRDRIQTYNLLIRSHNIANSYANHKAQ